MPMMCCVDGCNSKQEIGRSFFRCPKETASSRNQIEVDDNIEVVNDEGDAKDVILSIIISRDQTVVDDQDYFVLCTSSPKATSPISPTFVEDGTNTETAMDFDNSECHSGYPISSKADEESDRGNEENDKEPPAAASIVPISSSSLVGLEADLATSIDLDKCENHSIFSAKSEGEDAILPISFSSLVGQEANTATGIDSDVSLIKEEDEESDIKTPIAATFPISPSSLIGQEADLQTSIDLDKCENHSILSPKSDREDEESDTGNSRVATLPISSSPLSGQETDLETEIDLDKCENHSILSPKNEREDKESDKENSIAAISFGSLVGQAAKAATAIDLDISKNHNVSLIQDKEDKQVDKASSTAVLLRILSIHLVRHEADMQTEVDSDNSESDSVSPVSSDNEYEESNEKNSTAATLPISTKSLVGHGADTKTAMDSNSSKTEHEISDKENVIAASSPVSPSSLFGRGPATEKAMDSDNSESRNESLITGQQGEESDKENPTAVVRNPVNSTDEPSESQGESSNQFEANRCDTLGDTPANSQKYQDNPVISDRKTFKCKLCSYSSTIKFDLV